jgi:hypothetical protein
MQLETTLNGRQPYVCSGQKRKCPGPRGTSVLPSGADIVSMPRHVRLVPITDVIGKGVLQERLVFLVELFAGFKVEIFARLAAPSDLPLLL